MKYLKVFLLMLSIGSCAQAKKVSEYEKINLTILKIERVREDSEGGRWVTNKLTMRDSRGIIYKASAKCLLVSDIPNSDMSRIESCQRLGMPRIAGTYDAKFTFGGTLIYFGE